MIKKIYLDMDKVLADFDKQIQMLMGKNYGKRLPNDEFWNLILNTPNFWENLPVMPHAHLLFDVVKAFGVPVEILTAPSRTDYMRCYAGKIIWAKKNGFNVPVNFARAGYKHFYAEPGSLLIDDNEMNIEMWASKPHAHGILYKDFWEALEILAKYKQQKIT